MAQKYSTQFGPALVLAFGLLVSSFITALASGSPWRVGAGILVLTASILGADILDAWLRRQTLVPSLNGVLAAVALLVASGIVAIQDAGLVSMLIPVLGAGSASIILLKGQRGECASRRH